MSLDNLIYRKIKSAVAIPKQYLSSVKFLYEFNNVLYSFEDFIKFVSNNQLKNLIFTEQCYYNNELFYLKKIKIKEKESIDYETT